MYPCAVTDQTTPETDDDPRPAPRGAWAVGVATYASDGRVLDVWYPRVQLGELSESGATELDGVAGDGPGTFEVDPGVVLADDGSGSGALTGPDHRRAVERRGVLTVIADLDTPPLDAHDAYLRLHLLSHRLIRPHGANLDGLFGLLSNVVWTSHGPCAVEGFDLVQLKFRAAGIALNVFGVDKFPRMVDYVVPSGVRIADADRVRLGAHLAEGTTVMHEGFCNFNAGTLGASMVEGRISAGVVVGDGSDIGGGASIMGTLSGGGKEVISIGEGCLIGANGGVGISLGDRCTVEAGLYVTAGTVVTLPDGAVVKAGSLSGRDDLLFRRNSVSGSVEVLSRTVDWGSLNSALHQND